MHFQLGFTGGEAFICRVKVNINVLGINVLCGVSGVDSRCHNKYLCWVADL